MATLIHSFTKLHLQGTGATHAHAMDLNHDRSQQGEDLLLASGQQVSGRFLTRLFRNSYQNHTKASAEGARDLLPSTVHLVDSATTSFEDAACTSSSQSQLS